MIHVLEEPSLILRAIYYISSLLGFSIEEALPLADDCATLSALPSIRDSTARKNLVMSLVRSR